MFQETFLIKKNEFGDFETFILPCLMTNEFCSLLDLVSEVQTPYTFVDLGRSNLKNFVRYLRYAIFSSKCEDRYLGINLVVTFLFRQKVVVLPFMFLQLDSFVYKEADTEFFLNKENINGCLFYVLIFWLYWLTSTHKMSRFLFLGLQNQYLYLVRGESTVTARSTEQSSMLQRSFLLRHSRSWKSLNSMFFGVGVNVSRRWLLAGQSRYFSRFLSPKTASYSRFANLYFTRFRKVLSKLFCSRNSRFHYAVAIRAKVKYLRRFFPRQILRQFRFVRKFKARFTVRALHTNLFFTIRQGNNYFLASTGMFDDLKRGTKRKRTLMAGWFLADRLFSSVNDSLKVKSIFRIDIYGRTSGRRGIWFSWRTKQWRIFQVYSRTPIAFNGTRARRKRRL